MRIKHRRALFLASTIARNTQPRRDGEDGMGSTDGIEVGAGFAALEGKDGNPPGPTVEIDDGEPAAKESENKETVDKSSEGEEGEGGDDGEGETGEDGKPVKKGQKSAQDRIKESRREVREERLRRQQLEARLEKLEQGLTEKPANDTNAEIGEKPDPKDLAKYPLGALDDQYIEDAIEWAATKKAAEAISTVLRRDQEQTAAAQRDAGMAELRETFETLTTKGEELFDDFEKRVVEAGMRGDYELTETTFKAAAASEFGAHILHELAGDKEEALWLSQQSPSRQRAYVKEKSDEFAAKAKGRTKPKAEDVPENLPRGRNSSNPIRLDTENLDDFRKIWYKQA